MISSRPFRVAVVQFAPEIGKVEDNVKRANDLCSKLQPDSVDLVCFPEMALTGYDFPSAEAIQPFLEEPQTGPTSQFCRELATRLRCYVAAGYPERLSEEEKGLSEGTATAVGANSAIIYGPDGAHIEGYRKVCMFDTDKTWAKPGSAFTSFSLPDPIGTLSLGICIDLNPQTALWSMEKGPFEIADYCLSTTEGKPRTNVLLLLNAWLDSKEEMSEQWDLSTLNYWLLRLRPLWREKGDSGNGLEDPLSHQRVTGPEQTIVVICNRCGDDNGTLFAGTSAVFKLQEGSGHPDVVGVMTRQQEGVRIWTVE
ncbi:hydrolase [Schizopora paradoxa]|uniref:Hydrolase n=1 Tax=Schizopora paradoxa TaxID=27342 RepID=A0A0H2RRZ5_9AGAM|nr:hydrolase [Schizopora paradoxa]